MERISKDAATVLRALYSQYQSRRKVGQSKREALFFNSVQNIHDDLCPEMLIDDVDEAMREIDRVGYLNNDYGDMTILQCCLTNAAIVDCENAVSDKAISVIDFLSKIPHP